MLLVCRCSAVVTWCETDVGGEGAAHEFLPVSVLGLSGITAVLEVPQGCLEVLDVVLELVHPPCEEREKTTH